jgi:hypothetical protein
MKKLTITGVVLAIVAMGVFLGYTKVYTKSKGEYKQFIITLDKKTGSFVSLVDEKGNKPTEVSPEELSEIYHSKDGFRHVITLVHAHASPGCIYYYDYVLRRWVRQCWPQP